MASSLSSAIDAGVYTDLTSLLSFRVAARDVLLFARQTARSSLLGDVRSRFRGRGMEFEEVRQYQPGDDIRNIDWRVSARTGKVHTKLFAEERERPVHIVCDQRSNMFFGTTHRFKSVLAAELASCIAWAALAGSDRIGGQVVGDNSEVDVRAKRNKRAVLQLLQGMTQLNQQLPGDSPATKTLAHLLEECRRVTRPGTAIFIVSDFQDFDQPCEKSLSQLGRHQDLTLLRVFDPLEEDLSITGRLGISDGVRQEMVTVSGSLQQRYQRSRQTFDQHLENAAQRSRATLLSVSTDQSALDFLRKVYR